MAELTGAPTPVKEEFNLLVESSKQYEAYLRISAVASTLSGPEGSPEDRPYADWAHPIGLVVGTPT
jgi:hypothetical protein